jgi:hypothetical protein
MSKDERADLIAHYGVGPIEVEKALAGATDEELDRPVGADGWTARQVVHHLADSETNAYVRLRKLLAEDRPTIQGYDESAWATALHYDRPIEASLAVLRAVRASSAELLARLPDADWAREGTHTESGPYSVEGWLRIYARHGHEHAAQIRRARRGEA